MPTDISPAVVEITDADEPVVEQPVDAEQAAIDAITALRASANKTALDAVETEAAPETAVAVPAAPEDEIDVTVEEPADGPLESELLADAYRAKQAALYYKQQAEQLAEKSALADAVAGGDKATILKALRAAGLSPRELGEYWLTSTEEDEKPVDPVEAMKKELAEIKETIQAQKAAAEAAAHEAKMQSLYRELLAEVHDVVHADPDAIEATTAWLEDRGTNPTEVVAAYYLKQVTQRNRNISYEQAASEYEQYAAHRLEQAATKAGSLKKFAGKFGAPVAAPAAPVVPSAKLGAPVAVRAQVDRNESMEDAALRALAELRGKK